MEAPPVCLGDGRSARIADAGAPNISLIRASVPHNAGDFAPAGGGRYLPRVLNTCPIKPSGVQLARPILPPRLQTRASSAAAGQSVREVTVGTFTGPALDRLARYRDKVNVHATADLPQNGARIRVQAGDGRVIEREQLILRGSIEDPMTWGELEHKFRANLRGRISDDAADTAVELIASLEKQQALTALTEALLG